MTQKTNTQTTTTATPTTNPTRKTNTPNIRKTNGG
jgi:hypothetical protein